MNCCRTIVYLWCLLSVASESEEICMPLKDCQYGMNLVNTKKEAESTIAFLRQSHCGYSTNDGPMIKCPRVDPDADYADRHCTNRDGNEGSCKGIKDCPSMWNTNFMQIDTEACPTIKEQPTEVCCSEPQFKGFEMEKPAEYQPITIDPEASTLTEVPNSGVRSFLDDLNRISENMHFDIIASEPKPATPSEIPFVDLKPKFDKENNNEQPSFAASSTLTPIELNTPTDQQPTTTTSPITESIKLNAATLDQQPALVTSSTPIPIKLDAATIDQPPTTTISPISSTATPNIREEVKNITSFTYEGEGSDTSNNLNTNITKEDNGTNTQGLLSTTLDDRHNTSATSGTLEPSKKRTNVKLRTASLAKGENCVLVKPEVITERPLKNSSKPRSKNNTKSFNRKLQLEKIRKQEKIFRTKSKYQPGKLRSIKLTSSNSVREWSVKDFNSGLKQQQNSPKLPLRHRYRRHKPLPPKPLFHREKFSARSEGHRPPRFLGLFLRKPDRHFHEPNDLRREFGPRSELEDNELEDLDYSDSREKHSRDSNFGPPSRKPDRHFYEYEEVTPKFMTPVQSRGNGRTATKDYSVCGREAGIKKMSRIVGGLPVALGEYPWMALIQYTSNNGIRNGCGGTLINSNYVLTAAHCIDDTVLKLRKIKLYRVILGEYDTSSDPDCVVRPHDTICAEPSRIHGISHVIKHPQFDSVNALNDIGLIKLDRNVIFSDYIKPICLPAKEFSYNINETILVTGWGRTERGGGHSATLMKAILPVVDQQICNKMGVSLIEGQMCLGLGNGIDTCTGDSGGPMMIQRMDATDIVTYQFGIISYGFATDECGQAPSVNTFLPFYLDWLNDKLLE